MEKIISKDMIANGLENKNIDIWVDYSGWWIKVKSENVEPMENAVSPYPSICWGWPKNRNEVWPEPHDFTFDELVNELYKVFEHMRTHDAYRNSPIWLDETCFLSDKTFDEYAMAYDCLAS